MKRSFLLDDFAFEEIFTIENLTEAYKDVRRGKAKYVEVKRINKDIKYYMKLIRDTVKNGQYKIAPSDYSTRHIKDSTGKIRKLMSLKLYPHRIIQSAIMKYIFPFYCRMFYNHSCAAIVGKGTKYAFELANRFTHYKKQYKYCLKIDIQKFYPSIDRTILKQLLSKNIKSPLLKNLIFHIIDSFPGDKGIPIGSYLSQLFSNLMLHPLDGYCKHQLKIRRMIRYADDIVIFGENELQLQFWHSQIKTFVEEKLNLTLKKQNKYIFNVEREGVNFVGYIFFPTHIWLRPHIIHRLKKLSHEIRKIHKEGKLINYSQYCAMNSYIGYVMNCDGYLLFQRYIFPCANALGAYHKNTILKYSSTRRTEEQKNRKTKKCINNIFTKSKRCGRYKQYYHTHYKNVYGRFKIGTKVKPEVKKKIDKQRSKFLWRKKRLS